MQDLANSPHTGLLTFFGQWGGWLLKMAINVAIVLLVMAFVLC